MTTQHVPGGTPASATGVPDSAGARGTLPNVPLGRPEGAPDDGVTAAATAGGTGGAAGGVERREPSAHPDRPADPLVALLARACSQGPDAEAALGRLLEHLYWPVFRFARARLRRFADASDWAADIAQETLVRLAKHVTSCQATTDGELMMWALVTARNVLIDAYRAPGSGLAARQFTVELERAMRRFRGMRHPLSQSFDESAGRRESGSPDHEQLLRLAVDAYDAAPEATARLLWWRLVGGEEWAEIARRFATTAGGAKRRYQRVQGALRRHVERRVAALSAEERAGLRALLARFAAGRRPPRAGEQKPRRG